MIDSMVVVEFMSIPDRLKVSSRVIGRTVFRQNAMLPPADMRVLEECMTELRAVATIRPADFMVPAYSDEIREYVEILVFRAVVKSESASDRVAAVLHRSIPYPLVSILDMPAGRVHLSAAHKKKPATSNGRVMVESVNSVVLSGLGKAASAETAFMASLDVSTLPSANLMAMYQKIVDRVTAMRAAAIVGIYAVPPDHQRAREIETALAEFESLGSEIQSLRAKAERETQMNRRVEYNDEIALKLPRQMAAVERMKAIMTP